MLVRCTFGGHGQEKLRENWLCVYHKLMSSLTNTVFHLYDGYETGNFKLFFIHVLFFSNGKFSDFTIYIIIV